MNIIIIGAGDVGTHLAGTLIAEGHDITVIDRDPDRLSVLNQNYDLLALEGNGANPRLLRNAGLERADMLLAVTSTDEVNLLAAFIAGNRRVPRIVARVQDQEYLTDLAILNQQHSSVKFVHPAEVISRELVGLVQHAEALESHTFADGRITVMELDMEEQKGFTSVPMRDLARRYSRTIFRIMLVIHNGEARVPQADDIIQPGDKIYIVFRTVDMPQVFRMTGHVAHMARSVMIYGGGTLPRVVAAELEAYRGISVKLMDPGGAETRMAASGLHNTLVLRGDATDIDLLVQEGISRTAVFMALTGEDEKNLVASLMARHLKVPRTITLVNKQYFLPIARTIGLGHTVHKQTATANAILQYLRRGKVIKIQALAETDAQIIEYQVTEKAPVVNIPVRDLQLPTDCLICGIYRRDGSAEVPHGESIIRPEDRVMVFSFARQRNQVENLFGTL